MTGPFLDLLTMADRVAPLADRTNTVNTRGNRPVTRVGGVAELLTVLNQAATPEGRGERFQPALQFVLNQELHARHRRKPGLAMQSETPGAVGIDPPAKREFARRNPDVARRMISAMDASLRGPMEMRELRQSEYHRAIYSDIWNASGAADLPPGLDIVHFDAAVNHGPGVARRMLRESGGDPSVYLDLREAEYQRQLTGPNAQKPRGQFKEIPAQQRGWLEQRIPALRALLARR
jgi:hypothetical protein